MSKAEKLIFENLDVWTSAVKAKSSAGRGSSNKRECYGIGRLRELILELAINGLLVLQDPEDEPACISVEKVRRELEEAVAEKRIKKQQLPPLSKRPGEISLPTGWAQTTLPEVAQPIPYSIKRGPFGSSIKKDMFVSDGYKVYEQQHAIYGEFSVGSYYLLEEDFNNLKAFELRPSDVIISCSGTVGRVSIAPDNLEPGVINQALLKLSLHEGALLNEYFKILFPTYFMGLDTLSDLKGTAQKNMPGMPVMKSLQFPLPPLAEQHRIVAKVDELMALCDQLEQEQENSLETHDTLVRTLLDALTSSTASTSAFAEAWQRIQSNFDILFTTETSIDHLKQTILQLAVMGKLVPQDPEDEPASKSLGMVLKEREELPKVLRVKSPRSVDVDQELMFELPRGWIYASPDQITSFHKNALTIGPFGSSLLKSDYKDLGVPLVFVREIRSETFGGIDTKYISLEKAKELESHKVRGGDLLITKMGDPPGDTAIYPSANDPAIITADCIKLTPHESLVTSEFLRYALRAGFLAEQFAGITLGVAQKKVSLSRFRVIAIPLPPLAEQHRIVAKVDDLMAICDELKANLVKAQETQLNLADSLVEQAIG